MNLPAPFTAAMKSLLKDKYTSFADSLNEPSPVSVRVNDKLQLVPSACKVAWCDSGYYLDERPLFTADPLFHAGAYYVQEASSMFLQQVLEQFASPGSTVLDLSAAPGGKSTLISRFLNKKGFLVSNEIVRSRAYILSENMIKWGNDNFLVCNNAPEDFQRLPSFFDVVVVDAPCSGEGMFRKDAGAIDEWSEQNVVVCAARQKDILSGVWDTLKTDGILIYSTCTYNETENEYNVKWMEDELGAEVLHADISNFPEITATEKGCRFFPHKTRGEGFFISVVRKTSPAPRTPTGRKKSAKSPVKAEHSFHLLKNQLLDSENRELIFENNLITAIPKEHAEKVDLLRNNLKTMHYGITLAEQKGKDLIPHTSLALSKSIDIKKMITAEVDITTAIQYLSKEAIALPETAKGYVLLTYESVPIGWVKNIGSRCNNLYPAEWRIRMKIQHSTPLHWIRKV